MDLLKTRFNGILLLVVFTKLIINQTICIELDYDPLLINCFEGLLETDHPYKFVAFRALMELLESDGAGDKTIPII
jgi:hypothetical protein